MAFTDTLTNTGEEGHTGSTAGDVVDKLHGQDGLADTGTTDNTDLASFDERREEVDADHHGVRADAVRKGRRGQAKADLLEAVQLAERFRTVNGTYEGFVLPAAYSVSPREGAARYNVGFEGAAGTFTLTADPISGGGQEKDTKCLALSITQAGVKDASGSDADNCW